MAEPPSSSKIDINCTLYSNDGEILYEDVQAAHVPRVGELVTFSPYRSYQVVDILWHLQKSGGGGSVTVTACELSWHEHIDKVIVEWREGRSA